MFQTTAHAAALTEPPTVLYGKVIQHGGGAAYQLYRGNLTLTVVNDANPSNQIALDVALQPTGTAGEFSYRVELPVKYLPALDELSESLSVGFNLTSFHIESLEVNDEPAVPLDAAETAFITSFAGRADQHRLDLLVSLVEVDSDGDGLPDWWEDLHGLNRLDPNDAAADDDGDGLTSLEEFRLGTDPNVSNSDPTLLTPSILVPAGGVAGLGLTIVDTDTDPSLLLLSYGAELPGLMFFRGTTNLPAGEDFTYAEVKQGLITLKIDPSFAGGSVQLNIHDLGPGGATVASDLGIDVFSPMQQHGRRPAMWLDAGKLVSSPVEEWADASANLRDGYQPFVASQPDFAASAVDFGGHSFLYIDERGLEFNQFTALIAFELTDTGPADQTLLRTSDVDLKVGGATNVSQNQKLIVSQAGRTTTGPTIGAGVASQFTLVSRPTHSSLNFGGRDFFANQIAAGSIPVSFATLGGAQTLLQPTANKLFNGTLREVLVYDAPLTPTERTRNEDYQLSRWSSLVVWDYRDQTTPLNLTGDPNRPNALDGGWGNDCLIGGNLDDVLRGGPGTNTLTGGPGVDIYQISKKPESDLITDYAPQEFEVIDLTDIFADQSGDPTNFVSLRNEVVRGPDNIPHVYTMLDLNYDGLGNDVNQTVMLANTVLTEDDLPLLVSKGLIRLGGPQYPGSDPTMSFADWAAIEYPGESLDGLAALDTDGDGLQAIFEYLYGTNPHVFNSAEEVPFSIRIVDGHLEIYVVTIEDPEGVILELQGSPDLESWNDAGGQFDLHTEFLGNGRVRRIYRATQPLDGASQKQFFRLKLTQL